MLAFCASTMAAISVRGLEEAQLEQLKQEARQRGISLNRLVLQRLVGDLASAGQPNDDLDALAGTWTAEEAEDFTVAIAPLEQVDPQLWA